MATMIDSIAMTNKMSTGFRSVNQSMSLVLDSFGAIRYASYNMMDNSSFQTAQTEINKTSIALAGMEEAMAPAPLQAAQNEINKTSSSLAGMEGILRKISYKKVLSIAGQFFNLADTVAQTTARLDQMRDKTETVGEIQQKIFNSAQASRSSYLGTAAAVAKLGTMAGKSFGNTDEIIAFTELMNKNFIVGGASVKGQSAAMAKLTQAMAEGKLQGEGLQAVMGVSPLLMQGIEEQMRNAGVGGTMTDWAKDGRLTTDVIKAALFSMSDEIEQRFNETPMTWAQVWQGTMDQLLRFSEPVLGFISMLANHWKTVEPVVWGLAAAIGAYMIQLKWATIMAVWSKVVSAAQVIALLAQAVGYSVLAFATGSMTVAQNALNMAQKASPMGLMAVMIGFLVVLIVKMIQSVGGLENAWRIAVGAIVGVIFVLYAFLMNTFVIPTWNSFARLANFLGNVFNDPVAAVKMAYYDMALDSIGSVLQMAKAIEAIINSIPGVEIDITSGFEKFQKKLEKDREKIKDESGWKEYVKEMDYLDYKEQWNKGTAIGQKGADQLRNTFSGMRNPGMGNYGMGNYDSLDQNTADTANNTRAMADSMSISEEDIKYLRDIAEREVINRFTTADLSVTMQTTANVNSALDIDGVISQLENKTYEMLISTAEGV